MKLTNHELSKKLNIYKENYLPKKALIQLKLALVQQDGFI